jgi:serine protease Do
MSIRSSLVATLHPALLSAAALTLLGACSHTAGMRAPTEAQSDGRAVASSLESARQAVAPFATPVSTVGAPNVADLVERVSPAVVSISTVQEASGPEGMTMPGPFGFFFGHPDEPGPSLRLPPQQGTGTGLIIDPRGYVLTNDHVVRDARDVRVRTADHREYRAKVLGQDSKLDLAVLQLEGAKGLASAAIGTAKSLRPGETVMAIGSPYGLEQSVTLGIVSAKARNIGAGPYDDFIQTDAPINPGNSGGPLFNMRGEVVGINTAIRAGASGIGFAIPIDDVKAVLDQLEHQGFVDRGKLGLAYQPIDAPMAKALGLDPPRGALVSEVEKGGPADKAGIREGDVIVAVAGTPVTESADLARLIASRPPASKVALELVREGRTIATDATLDRLENHAPAPAAAAQTNKAAVPELAGVSLRDEPDGSGVRVLGLDEPRLASGIEPDDVIVQAGRAPVHTVAELAKALHGMPSGSMALLKVRRGSHDHFVAVQLGS